MKKCQFCAEEIQDAAIVCKHCGRDLDRQVTTVVGNQTVTSTVAPKQMTKKKLAGIVLSLAAGLFVVAYFYDDHQQFLKWSDRRDAWHTHCDQFVGKSLTFAKAEETAAAENCNRELNALSAEAKTNGWISQ